MRIPPPEQFSAWRVVQVASFAVGIAVFSLIGSSAGIRWFGLVMLFGAIVQIWQRRIPYGWEGREPSGYITGFPAVILGFPLGMLGVAMLTQPDVMLALLGWDGE